MKPGPIIKTRMDRILWRLGFGRVFIAVDWPNGCYVTTAARPTWFHWLNAVRLWCLIAWRPVCGKDEVPPGCSHRLDPATAWEVACGIHRKNCVTTKGIIP